MALLEVLQDGNVVSVVPVGSRMHIGRAPSNDLVLTSSQVSKRHALIQVRDGALWIEDLGSTNGTQVDGVEAREPTKLAPGSLIQLGPTVQLRLQGQVEASDVLPLVEDRRAGVRTPILFDRFHIGSGSDNHIVLPKGPERAATLLVDPDGDIWLGTMEDERLLEVDTEFELEGHPFCLVMPDPAEAPTRMAEVTQYPYRLVASLEGKPYAELIDLSSGNRHRITAANRAVLLYLLARQNQQDQDQQPPMKQADQGWCSDEDLSLGIWGRAAREQTSSNFHVLLHRLRKEVDAGGFDPWFIEKRRGGTRARVAEVEIVD